MKKFSLGLIIGLFVGVLATVPNTAFADSVLNLFVNNKQIDCTVPPQFIDGVLMVPIYDIAEPLGIHALKVAENGDIKSIYIYSNTTNSTTTKNYVKEAHNWSDKLLPLCSDLLDFMASDNKDVSYGINKIDKLDSLTTDFAKWNCPDEYKDFKNLLIETSDNFMAAAKAQIVYLKANGTSNQIKALLARNEQISSAKRSMAKLLAEVNNLKEKGLL